MITADIALPSKILTLNVADGTLIISFIRNLYRHQKCSLLLGRLDLPFEAIVVTTIIKLCLVLLLKSTSYVLPGSVNWRLHGFLDNMFLCKFISIVK